MRHAADLHPVSKIRERVSGSRATARLPSRWSGDLTWALALGALAWFQRLVFLWANRDRDWPYSIFYEGDAEVFFRYARAILAGELYDNGIPFHPPGFAGVLAGVHTLVGAGAGVTQFPHLAIKSVLALFGAATVTLLVLLVRPYLGPAVARVAGLLAVFHFGLMVTSIAPVSEGLYTALMLAVLLLWSRRFEHPLAAPEPFRRPATTLTAAIFGVLLAALALTRAEGIGLAVLLLGVGAGSAVRRPRPDRLRALRPWVVAAFALVLALAPWAVRNSLRLGALQDRLGPALAEPLPRFVPLTLYGPINLALANHAGADGSFSRAALAANAGQASLELTHPEHLDFILHGDRRAFTWMREHPGDFVRLAARKLALAGGALRLGWTQWNAPGGLDGIRRPVDVFVPRSGAGLWVTLPLLLVGLGLLSMSSTSPGPPRRWLLLAALPTAVTALAVTLFFGYARLGLVVLPLWLPAMAAALVGLTTRSLRLDPTATPRPPLPARGDHPRRGPPRARTLGRLPPSKLPRHRHQRAGPELPGPGCAGGVGGDAVGGDVGAARRWGCGVSGGGKALKRLANENVPGGTRRPGR